MMVKVRGELDEAAGRVVVRGWHAKRGVGTPIIHITAVYFILSMRMHCQTVYLN